MKCHPLPRRGWVQLSSVLTLGALMAAGFRQADAATFSNAAPIEIPFGLPTSPYPSSITVAQLTGVVSRVSVSLNGVSHVFPDDLDIVLAGPGGQSVILMSDAGGGNAVSGLDLTFSQEAGVTLPDSGPITSGTYEPTDYEPGDILFPPAPPGPFSTTLDVFKGTDPNGQWHLYAHDDATFNGGGLIAGGWRLEIDLALPPVITAHPQDQEVSPGGTATFGVTVKGTPPFGYQWLRNGQVIVPFGQGKSTLTISNVQTIHAGTYAVVVTNLADPLGVTSSSATLNVLGPLTLVESPQSQVAKPGETVVLQVTVAGTPPLFHQWRLNGALLPDQTNAALTLTNVHAASGGAFSVTVFNANDVFTTEPARLVVDAATVPAAADDFNSRPHLQGFRGVQQGDSTKASSAQGEPVFPGGGKTVWSQWQAPANGIVTLTAQGSAFDTLLGVFTGTTVSNLALVTMDDDRGGFYTSSLQFNAVQGTVYQWMLDGFSFEGIGGEFTLTWRLEPTTNRVPVIVTGPEGQGVQQGSNATFSVATDSALDAFQWYFNAAPIPGATGNAHTVLDVQSADVGLYSVRVSNSFGFSQESFPVPLQRGSGPGYFAVDKTELASLRPSLGAISIGLGETGWNEFPSQADGGPADPNPCDYPFFKTIGQSVHAEDGGVVQVVTTGSEVFLLLGVYEGTPTGSTNVDVLVACDVVSGLANQPCVVQFNASHGTDYTAVVAPLQGDGTELIRITATMGTAPPIPEDPQFCLIPSGGSILLSTPESQWVPLPSVQWRLNGVDIAGATGTTFHVTNFSAAQVGAYSVVMSNFAGIATNTVAHLELAGPLLLNPAMTMNNGATDFVITASNATPFVLVTKTDMNPEIPWLPVTTNLESCATFLYTNATLLADPLRFYRAVPWVP